MSIKDIAEQIKGDTFLLNKDLAILTEDFEDQWFWKDVFEKAKPNLKVDFPKQAIIGAAGSGTLAKYLPYVDHRLVVCKDSDNQFIYADEQPLQAPFIYETYVYSIENYCFFPSNSLNRLIHDMTLVEYDITEFISSYAKHISPILYLSFYGKINYIETINNLLTESVLSGLLILDLSLIDNINDLSPLLKELDVRINEHLAKVEKEIGTDWYKSIIDTEIPKLKQKLLTDFGITESDSLSFFKGHLVDENLLTPIIIEIITQLKIQKEAELLIEFSSKSKEVQIERINAYKNRINKDLSTKSRENYRYHLNNNTKFFPKIIEAIQRDFPTS